MNATVLIAQSDVKIGTGVSLNNAVGNFEKALKMTEKQNDNTAGNAIVKALADCRQKLVKLSLSGDEVDGGNSESEEIRDSVKSPIKEEFEEKKKEPVKEESTKGT